ncbi:hypothetical protein AWZ03_006052 [Drosophila navojoa]|uniref:Uncharacterized protein n=1 Tax=Drosophila navojoa TaxID=7232 RepID=A0A484BFS6_DRONA|nr:hypothetical protein AWZ03_006052 [Drosophila navojoa]
MSSSMPLTMDQRRLNWPAFLLSLLLLQATANAIDLSRLYGHMANPIQKRSVKEYLHFQPVYIDKWLDGGTAI